MAQFKYAALSRNGERVEGIVDAFNELDAAMRVKETCDVILRISEATEKKGLSPLLSADLGGGTLNKKAFIIMCSQFSIILKSGVPIVRTVNLIADKTTDKVLKKILTQVGRDVEGGRSLSASFEDHGGKLFPATFVETIRSGEESGNLDRAFDTMQAHFDKQMKMSRKVWGAMAYPAFVMVVAVGVVIVLMAFVVPKFLTIFDGYDAELPFMTQLLIAISNFFSHHILKIVVVLALLFIGFQVYAHTEDGHMNVSKLQLKLPVLGEIASLNAASQFANSMATLLNSGLTMNKAVGITAKTLDNYYVSTETGKLSTRLEEGHTLGDSMRENQVMPDILVDMTAVGEESGELAETLNTIAKYYDAELETAIQSALAKLEPALLVGLAGIAGFIVVSIYMSMFALYASM